MQHTNHLRDLLKVDHPFFFTAAGELWVLPSIINHIPWLKRYLHKKVAVHFAEYLDSFEAIPIEFIGPQTRDFNEILELIPLFEKYLTRSHTDTLELKRRRIALLYRLEIQNGGIDCARPDLLLLGSLHEAADEWKSRQKIFWESNLTEYEIERLQEAARYASFIPLIFESSHLADEFFTWIIRDGIDPAPFIEFPGHYKKIIDAELNGRIGRMGGRLLQVKKREGQKHLTLLVEGRDESILDTERLIHLRGGYILTFNDIFSIFKEKKIHPGNLECFPFGIINWNSHCLGWWNNYVKAYEVVDVTMDEWWNQLPLFESLTIAEAKERYGAHMDGKSWNLAAKASREYFNLNFEKTHAYLEIAIPDGRGGYRIFDFGKFATRFPANMWEIITTISVSVQATIAYPDENVYYTHRQHIGYSFPITPEEGQWYMQAIHDDILMARTGNMVFQIESENCGRWIQSRLEEQMGRENVPNLFKLHMAETEPDGIWKLGWDFTRLLPKQWQTRFMAVCQYPLGAWKGCWVLNKDQQPVWMSLTHSPYWDDGIVYLPSLMHKSDEKGVLSTGPGRHHRQFSTIKELTHQGIKMEKDPFASLDLFERKKAA